MENAAMESGHHEHSHHHMPSGDFKGHSSAGSAFIFVGCLWTYNALFRYHVARRQAALKGYDDKKLNYKNALFSKYHSGWARAAPVEAIAVLFCATVVNVSEIIYYFWGKSATMVLHHLLMYSFFGSMGAVQILHYYKFTVPPSLEYVAFMLANAVLAFLLSNHVFGRAIVDAQVHTILLYLSLVQILCVGIEIIYKKSITASLGRSLMFVVQGLWLNVAACIVYPLSFMHKYDLNDHTVLDFVSALAVVAVVVASAIAAIMNVIIARRVRNMGLATVNFIVSVTHQNPRTSGAKGEVESPLITDSDNDV